MLRHLLYPLLPYRSIVYPFLVLTAIVVPCWLIFRLYRSRTSRHSASFGRELVLLAFVVYLSGLAAATLEPNRSRAAVSATDGLELRPNLASLTCSSAMSWRSSTARGFCMRNARGNVALFIPLGVLIPLVWLRRRFWSGLQIALAVSISIEVLQYLSRPWSNRLADVNDVILNVVGAALGLAVVSILRWRPRARTEIARA